jgi:hypothetical protein
MSAIAPPAIGLLLFDHEKKFALPNSRPKETAVIPIERKAAGEADRRLAKQLDLNKTVTVRVPVRWHIYHDHIDAHP